MSNQLIITLYFVGGISALIYLWFIFLKPKPKSASKAVKQVSRVSKKQKRPRFQTPESETSFVESLPSKPQETSSAAQIRGGIPKLTPSSSSPVANDKLREDLMQLITDLKSVRQDAMVNALPNPGLSEAQVSDSDVVTALSETLISSVETTGEEADKRSKLSIDAALLFDSPEEVQFFEKEFSS